jgi:hypothetical protein
MCIRRHIHRAMHVACRRPWEWRRHGEQCCILDMDITKQRESLQQIVKQHMLPIKCVVTMNQKIGLFI